MGEVNITIGGRSFKLGCDDGEEQHLLVLAEHLGKHVEILRANIGQSGDEQLYLMAGLMVCDELWDSRIANDKLEEKLKARIISPDQVEILPPEARPVRQAGMAGVAGKAGVASGQKPARAPAGRPAAGPARAAPPKPVAKQT